MFDRSNLFSLLRRLGVAFAVVPLLAAILFVMLINLRGLRESGTLFAAPTYLFLAITLGLIGFGMLRTLFGDTPHVTGVAAVDSKVANHLIQTVDAARLLGTAVIVTGISASIAQTIVTIGIDLSRIQTVGDLQGGLELADRLLGYQTILGENAAAQIAPTAAV